MIWHRDIMDAVRDAVFLVDGKTGKILEANRAAEALCGRSLAELQLLHHTQLHPPESTDQIRFRFEEGIPVSSMTEGVVLHKDNHRIPVEITSSACAGPDGRQMWVGVFRDLTRRNAMQAARRQAELALIESQQRFLSLADTAPVMIWVAGTDKGCTFFNKPWLNFTGRTIDQEMGNGWADGVHPEDLDRCLGIYNSAFDARRTFQMEYQLRRSDGEYRWILDSGSPLYREGEFAGYIGSCIDVTEHRRIEERLRASEIRLLDAQRLAKVGNWELDLEANSIHWSDEMFRIFGRNEPPHGFKGFLKMVHEKDREKLLETNYRARATGDPLDVEYRIVRPDGEIRFVRSIGEVIKDQQGAVVRMSGAAQDITDQVLARDLLRESEQRLKRAERLSHVGNWHWDINANRISWSEEIHRIFGKPDDQPPTYEGFLEAIIPQDRERVDRCTKTCISGKRGRSIEFQITRPTGELRTVMCISDVLLNDEGFVTHLFGACQDITDLRRAQEETFARQKLESVGTLAGGIAHDFNNLLGGVLAQADLAIAELAAGAHPEEELKVIREATIRGSEIVRQLMIYAGKEVEVPGLVDVSRIVEQMLELLNVSISKHATLTTALAAGLPAVRAGAGQLRQIVMNLIMNASEAIADRDGVIRITTGLAENNCLKLEVSDTGDGMSQETQARVFDPFFTTKAAGHGLGLAVVQGIVRSLNGAIQVKSEPGHGTTFQILLPCAESVVEVAQSSGTLTPEAARLSQKTTVLLVEDEGSVRQAVSKVLHKAGYSVIEASDGSAALDAIRAPGSPIEILFLDITLPGTPSGTVYEEARRIRPEMRLIVTSAYSKELAEEALGAPIERFIRKPYRLVELTDLLRQTML
jgi:PAS domain S-box-containing protein